MEEVVQVLKRQASASDRLATGWKALVWLAMPPPSPSTEGLIKGFINHVNTA